MFVLLRERVVPKTKLNTKNCSEKMFFTKERFHTKVRYVVRYTHKNFLVLNLSLIRLGVLVSSSVQLLTELLLRSNVDISQLKNVFTKSTLPNCTNFLLRHCYELLCRIWISTKKVLNFSPSQVHYISCRQLWVVPLFSYCTY